MTNILRVTIRAWDRDKKFILVVMVLAMAHSAASLYWTWQLAPWKSIPIGILILALYGIFQVRYVAAMNGKPPSGPPHSQKRGQERPESRKATVRPTKGRAAYKSHLSSPKGKGKDLGTVVDNWLRA